ncbi:DUF2975 domain-containing protein [Paenibacillus cremeus]|uniref:DUF2975 domain-containing protein n=1 Tax=Paenibacillus cremeus TaxID=2163881 RepID=A0A559K3Z1_9BACL|nr:DUF2975 domain-containing protein [Paenibacillus cremeus]TVY06841.1 DUF2975 domain-containing protein [Paenibacillus cremeus]
MKQGTTLLLKLAVLLIGLPVLVMCVLGLPMIAKDAADNHYALAHLLYPVLGIMYVTAIPFFTALYQALKLLSYIDRNHAFSELSVNALKNIKYCAIIISVVYVAGLPLFYLLGEKDDAPGVIVIGLVLIFAPAVIATFSAVLQRLLKEAIDIKSENDLTV